jgi:hypothetical protein
MIIKIDIQMAIIAMFYSEIYLSRRFFGLVCFMVLNATFNYISVIMWRSVLLVEETEYPEKTTDLSQVTDKLYPIILYRAHPPWTGFELTTLVVKGTNCTGSCKSNYHTFTTTTAPNSRWTSLWLRNKQMFVLCRLRRI